MSKDKRNTGRPARPGKVIPFPGPKEPAATAAAPAPVPEFPPEVVELLQDYEPEQIELVIEMISRLLQFATTGAVERVPMNLSTAERQERARDAVADAYDADDDEMAMAALMDALDFDPENVEALLMLVERLASELPDSVLLYERIVKLAAEQLGDEAFSQDRGHFWLLLETRPYMRARHALARELLYEGKPKEAARHWAEMLELNPGDNQGVRYLLLAVYLTEGDRDQTRKLFDAFPGEDGFSAPFAWGRVLERFLWFDEKSARAALESARRVNPYLEPYLTGTKRPPKRLPLFYAAHSEDEAKIFAQDYAAAWKRHPAARKWLKSELKPIRERGPRRPFRG